MGRKLAASPSFSGHPTWPSEGTAISAIEKRLIFPTYLFILLFLEQLLQQLYLLWKNSDNSVAIESHRNTLSGSRRLWLEGKANLPPLASSLARKELCPSIKAKRATELVVLMSDCARVSLYSCHYSPCGPYELLSLEQEKDARQTDGCKSSFFSCRWW